MNFQDKISIIFVSFFSESLIENSIKQINEKIKIYIVENSRNYNLKKNLEQKYSNVKVIIPEKNNGNGAGINEGLKLANTKYIFYLDIDSFSYPFGKFDDESINLVKSNYKIGLTTLRSRFKTDKFSNFTLPRVPINKSTNIFKFFLKIKTPYEDLKYKNNVIL